MPVDETAAAEADAEAKDEQSEAGASPEAEAADEHIPPKQLYAFMWALSRRKPPFPDVEGGEEPDPELEQALKELHERYQQPLAPQFQLADSIVDRWLKHLRTCVDCRILVLEDGPTARPPKTEAEQEAEVQEKAAKRDSLKGLVIRDTIIGLVALTIGYTCQYIRNNQLAKRLAEQGDLEIRSSDVPLIDPLVAGFAMSILVAAWFLAEAGVGARELGWIDFTAWKRAVPVVGKAWAERSQKNKQQ